MNADLANSEVRPLPHGWEVPADIRSRLKNGPRIQRVVESDGHIVMQLHCLASPPELAASSTYYWRNRTGHWRYSDGRDGVETLVEVVLGFDNQVSCIARESERAQTAGDWFRILSDIAPLLRMVAGLHETLLGAQLLLSDSAKRELDAAIDAAHEVQRNAEMMQQQAQHSIDYLVARQQEIQANSTRAQARASHRLNIMAAIFMPLATISSIFGMNLNHGLESVPFAFWFIVLAGFVFGVGVGGVILQLRSWNPEEW